MPSYRLRSLAAPALCAGIVAAASLSPASASAASPYLVVPDAAVVEASPAYRYANMTNEEALAELDRREILYIRADAVNGVRAPVRLVGRLHGVYIHSSLRPEERGTSMFEILDARLALSLDDFAAVLERHDIDEVVHYTMYRPNVPPAPARPEPAKKHATAPAIPEATVPAIPEVAEPAIPEVAEPAIPEVAAPAKKAPPKKAVVKETPELGKGTKAPAERPAAREPTEGVKQKKASAPQSHPKPTPQRAGRGGAHGKSGPKASARPRTAPAKTAGRTSPALPAPPPAAPNQDVVRKPRGLWAPPGTRHPAGLAIDVAAMKRRDGSWISVAQHFDGHIGDRTCGEGARTPDAPDARELRSIACESMDLGIFTYVLTPNYNAAHVDHYHMEIKPGVRWFLIH